jgi:hypothetical protein
MSNPTRPVLADHDDQDVAADDGVLHRAHHLFCYTWDGRSNDFSFAKGLNQCLQQSADVVFGHLVADKNSSSHDTIAQR